MLRIISYGNIKMCLTIGTIDGFIHPLIIFDILLKNNSD